MQSVTLLSSADDGETWAVETDGLPNTGNCRWTVRGVATERARLAVQLIYEVDDTGLVPESEFAVSDALTITAPTGVEADPAILALRPANPVAGPLTVSYSLRSAAPAILTVYDVSGRQAVSHEVGSSGPGWHTAKLSALPAGVYIVRLSQAGHTLSSCVAVIR